MEKQSPKLIDILEGIWGAARMGFALLTPFLFSRRACWGSRDEEARRSLPGDDTVPNPVWEYTHAITAHAPLENIWRWLIQIGQGRGGFYSYEWLENIVGCVIHNADRILPEHQTLKVGDSILLAPNMPGLSVVHLEALKAIVLLGRSDLQTHQFFELSQGYPQQYINNNWVFLIEPTPDGKTRLLSRARFDYAPSMSAAFAYSKYLLGAIAMEMQRKMLLGIKKRAEAEARIH